MAIESIGAATTPLVNVTGSRGVAAAARPETGFVDSLGRLVVAAETAGKDANASVAGMLGGSTDVHDAMIALQQADIALQLTVQVRNKLVQAYQEIMRMPI